jgi:hypothetical protein
LRALFSLLVGGGGVERRALTHYILMHTQCIDFGNSIVGAPAPFSWKPHNWHGTGLTGSERGAAWRNRDADAKATQRAATKAPKQSYAGFTLARVVVCEKQCTDRLFRW